MGKFKETMLTPVLLLAVFGLVLGVNYLPADLKGMDENPYLSVIVVQLLTYAVPCVFYTTMRGSELRPGLRLKGFSPSSMLYLLHSAVFMVCGVLLISMIMYTVFPESFEASSLPEYAAFAMNQRVFDGLYLVMAFAVLPALTEEFLFRGIIIGEYESHGAGVAVVFSALVFAMSHFSIVRFPVYFFSGIMLALVLYATRSLMASILIHILNNAAVLLCEKYVLHIVDRQNVSLVLFVLIAGAVAVISGMLMCWEAQGIYRAYAEENVESPQAAGSRGNIFGRIADVFFSPTFLVVVILFVVASMAEF